MSPASPAPIHVPDAVLDDLRERLARVRWPEAPSGGWELGTDAGYLRELVAYWRDGFDWRARERELEAALPSFRARVRGLDLHFALLPGRAPAPIPLLLLHGSQGRSTDPEGAA